jgi:hypothetical protein
MIVEHTILQDFEYELEAGRNASWLSFSFRDLVIDNDDYKEALFIQFKKLPPHPKYHWFSKDLLSEGYLTKEEKRRWDNKHTEGVYYSDVESKLRDLVTEYNRLVSTNLLDKRYFGRSVLNTPMVKTLNQIGHNFTEFEKLVSSDKKESYQIHASAFASEIIALTDKLCMPDLKIEILNKFIDEGGNTDLMLGVIMQKAYYNTEKLRSEYDILKLLANKLLRDELSKAKTPGKSSLSAYEIALQYYLLSEAKEVETRTTTEAANYYHSIYNKSPDNIKKAINSITRLRKAGKPLASKIQFENVKLHLSAYPTVQKSIDNYLEQLN